MAATTLPEGPTTAVPAVLRRLPVLPLMIRPPIPDTDARAAARLPVAPAIRPAVPAPPAAADQATREAVIPAGQVIPAAVPAGQVIPVAAAVTPAVAAAVADAGNLYCIVRVTFNTFAI